MRHCVKDGPAARQAGRALDVLVRLQRARTIAPNGVEIKLRIPRTSTRRRPRNLTHCLIPTQPDDENQERRGARNKSRKTGERPREARPRRFVSQGPSDEARTNRSRHSAIHLDDGVEGAMGEGRGQCINQIVAARLRHCYYHGLQAIDATSARRRGGLVSHRSIQPARPRHRRERT